MPLRAYMSVGVVIGQNLFVTEPLLTHNGSAILTQTDSMAGAVPIEDESVAGGANFIAFYRLPAGTLPR